MLLCTYNAWPVPYTACLAVLLFYDRWFSAVYTWSIRQLLVGSCRTRRYPIQVFLLNSSGPFHGVFVAINIYVACCGFCCFQEFSYLMAEGDSEGNGAGLNKGEQHFVHST